MSDRFAIQTPAEQIAEEFRRRIRAGEWTVRIPGLHRLVAEFGVGRAATEEAIAMLIAAGEIIPGGVGRPMRPGSPKRNGEEPGTIIAYQLPHYIHSGQLLTVINAMAAVVPRPVTRLRFEEETPAAEILAHLRATQTRHIVAVALAAEISEGLAADGRSVISNGGYGEKKLAASVAVHFVTMIRTALRKAFACGHERVCFPLWRRPDMTINMLRAVIAEEYAAHGLRHSPEFDAPKIEDRSPESLHRCLRELFRHTPPTAMIVIDFSQWLATMTTLGKIGLSVPEDVSLITLSDVSEFAVVTPSQAHFRVDNESFANAVKKVLLTPVAKRAGQKVWIENLWVPGDSLGPPPPGRVVTRGLRP